MDAWLESIGTDPLAALATWLAEARAGDLFEPEAAALATSTPDGRPSVRMVLVRGVDEYHHFAPEHPPAADLAPDARAQHAAVVAAAAKILYRGAGVERFK